MADIECIENVVYRFVGFGFCWHSVFIIVFNSALNVFQLALKVKLCASVCMSVYVSIGYIHMYVWERVH